MIKKSRYFGRLSEEVALGLSVRDAAVTVGCAESTAYRMSRQADFAERVSAIRTESGSQVVGKLVSASTKAVDTLVAIMEGNNAKPSDRIAAASRILQVLVPIQEALEIRMRLDRIEQQQQFKVMS